MKHNRMIALISSLSLLLGCFSYVARCEETEAETAETVQTVEVTCEAQADHDPQAETVPDGPAQGEDAAVTKDAVPETDPAPQPPLTEPEPEMDTSPAPEPDAGPAPERTAEMAEEEIVAVTQAQTETQTEVQTEIQTEVQTEIQTEAVPAYDMPAQDEDVEGECQEGETDSPIETEPETLLAADIQEGADSVPINHEPETKETVMLPETEACEDIVLSPDQEQDDTVRCDEEDQEYGQEETFCPLPMFIRSVDPNAGCAFYKDFRFTRVDKRCAIVSPLSDGLIREKMDISSEAVGKIRREGLVFILKEMDGWCFVESGLVRGFMKKESLYWGDAVDDQVRRNGEDSFPEAVQLCAAGDNEAVTFTHTTVHEVIADKREGLVIRSTKILEYASPSSRVIGEAKSGTLVYLLAAAAEGWYFVESGNVRGFVPFDCILEGETAASILADEGERRAVFAREVTTPEENHSLYFTLQSVREAQESLPVFNTEAVRGAGSDAGSYTSEQLQLIWAIVAQEDNGSYEGALAVITSAMNRTESPGWRHLGDNALSQLTAPGQYCYSLDNYWQSRLGGNVPEYVKQAVNDCLVYGIRNHSYTSFRSSRGKTTGADAVRIGGNWFFGS